MSTISTSGQPDDIITRVRPIERRVKRFEIRSRDVAIILFSFWMGNIIGWFWRDIIVRWSLLLRQGRGENKVESCPS
jgi:hypothetical protein